MADFIYVGGLNWGNNLLLNTVTTANVLPSSNSWLNKLPFGPQSILPWQVTEAWTVIKQLVSNLLSLSFSIIFNVYITTALKSSLSVGSERNQKLWYTRLTGRTPLTYFVPTTKPSPNVFAALHGGVYYLWSQGSYVLHHLAASILRFPSCTHGNTLSSHIYADDNEPLIWNIPDISNLSFCFNKACMWHLCLEGWNLLASSETL